MLLNEISLSLTNPPTNPNHYLQLQTDVHNEIKLQTIYVIWTNVSVSAWTSWCKKGGQGQKLLCIEKVGVQSSIS